MKKKNLNGIINFKFDLDDTIEKKIYFELIQMNKRKRDLRILKLFLNYYYSDDELQKKYLEINDSKNRLLSIMENVSMNQSLKVISNNQSKKIKSVDVSDLDISDIKIDIKKDEKKSEKILEDIFQKSFNN